MGRKLCHGQLMEGNKMKCVDAEIRLQGQYALHLPSRSHPWALASSRGWLEALRPPAETTLGSEGVWVRKWEVVCKAPGKRLKATCRWAGLRNPLWDHEDACSGVRCRKHMMGCDHKSEHRRRSAAMGRPADAMFLFFPLSPKGRTV